MNKLCGREQYYPNGQLLSKDTYKDGILKGPFKNKFST
tara:strand:+ start:493 stop:606 length:114 start_codon:yes stop_codon:yes gene_type:complete